MEAALKMKTNRRGMTGRCVSEGFDVYLDGDRLWEREHLTAKTEYVCSLHPVPAGYQFVQSNDGMASRHERYWSDGQWHACVNGEARYGDQVYIEPCPLEDREAPEHKDTAAPAQAEERRGGMIRMSPRAVAAGMEIAERFGLDNALAGSLACLIQWHYREKEDAEHRMSDGGKPGIIKRPEGWTGAKQEVQAGSPPPPPPAEDQVASIANSLNAALAEYDRSVVITKLQLRNVARMMADHMTPAKHWKCPVCGR